ncbi:MAG: histidine kinase dimerization/phosphoacceptor domain -containing protein [Rhizomicrobium sp.]
MISWRNWIASRPRTVPTLPSGAKVPARDPASERGWPLRITLLIAVTVALLPIAVVSILQGIERARIDVAEVHDRLAQSAEGAAAGQENLLLSAEQIARALGNIGSVRRVGRDCDAVLGEALVGVKYFANISRLDSRGVNVCSALPLAKGANASARPVFQRARAARGFVVSGQIQSAVLHQPVIVGMWPLHDDKGRFDGVVSVVLQLHWLDFMVRARGLPQGAVVFIYDHDGNVLASSNPAVAHALIGTAQRYAGPDGHLHTGSDAKGDTWTFASSPLKGSVMSVAFAMRENRLFLPTYFHAGVDFLMPILMIALAWAGIWFATELQVTRWIDYLRRISATYRSGHYTIRPQLDDAPREFHMLGAGLSDMAESIQDRDRKLRDALAQKTMLIREIHHRVKNNLQIVMSLLSLQAGQLKDPAAREALMQAQVRINALALVHRILHEIEDQTTIDLKRLLHELTTQITEGMRGEQAIRIEEDLVPCEVSGDVAVPVALFAVEALTNIFKYAFPSGQGVIRIGLTREPAGRFRLAVADNGIGFDDTQTKSGIGTRLIRTFGQQIGGSSTLHSVPGKGTTIEVVFNDPAREGAREAAQ